MSLAELIRGLTNRENPTKKKYDFFIHSSDWAFKNSIMHLVKENYSVMNEIHDFDLFSTDNIETDLDNAIGIIELNALDMDKISFLLDFLKKNPRTYFVLVVNVMFINDLKILIQNGIQGILLRKEISQCLLQAIDSVLHDDTYISPELKEHLLNKYFGTFIAGQDQVNKLTEREYEVFFYLGMGDSPKNIAQRLSISVRTVGSYRERIKSKLEISNASELRQYAVQWFHKNYPAAALAKA
ncbi:MAG: response regulator transcription factor [Spirochaetales bacterium]|nr:response regulator transcription factor [Spirochaetales bacterium]